MESINEQWKKIGLWSIFTFSALLILYHILTPAQDTDLQTSENNLLTTPEITQNTTTITSSQPSACVPVDPLIYLSAGTECKGKGKDYKYSMDSRLFYQRNWSSIPGWMKVRSPYLATTFSTFQHQQGICGDAGEIGVHRGKFAIGLIHNLIQGERFLASDIFDIQLEVNTAGKFFKENTIEKLKEQLEKFGIDDPEIFVLRADSTTLTPSEICRPDQVGPFRMFSVDGGHSAEVVEKDITLVSQILVEGAVVAMDDWDGSMWPGVRDGFTEYSKKAKKANGRPPLVPFLYDSGKMWLTTPNSHSLYFHFIQKDSFLKNFLDKKSTIEVENGWEYYHVQGSIGKYTKQWETVLKESGQ